MINDGTPTADEAIEQIGADIPETDVVEVEAQSQPAAATPAKPATPTPAVPRDDRGRFAEQPSTPAPEPATAAAAPAETPAEPTAPDAAPAAEEASYPTATYRADGQEFDMPGTAVGEDGTWISPQTWDQVVLPLLAAGRAARGGSLQRTLQDKSREVQSWQQQAQAAQAQSQSIIAKIDQMVENGTIGQWLEDVHQQWPIMKAQAESNALRLQQQAAQQQLQVFQAEQQRQQMEPQFAAALENSLLQIGPQFNLTQDQLVGLYQQLNTPAMRNTWLVKAQYDDPMTGVRAGEYAIDTSVVQQWAQWASQYQPRQKAQAGVPPKVAEAQKQNAKHTAAAPPPVVGGKGGSAPSGKPTPPKYKDGKDALAKIFDDEGFQNFEVE